MKEEKPVIVVGAGVIGLFTAYYLLQEGEKVLVLDKGTGQDGCSFGNAGMVVPSHFIPLAAPGMIEKGIKWMFDSESPFYIKPRLSLSLMKWGFSFYKAANQKKVDNAIPVLRDIGLLSKKLYQDLNHKKLFDFSFEEKGLLMLCKSEESLHEETEVAALANKIGIEAKVLTKQEVCDLEPEIKPDVSGGVFFTGDTHLYPNQLVAELRKYLIAAGVEIKFNTELIDIECNSTAVERLKVRESNGEPYLLEAKKVVMAAGSWSERVGKQINLNIPVQAGKGYSLTNPQVAGKKLFTPSIFVEARVAITPMADQIRFGGTMEIGGINAEINRNRVNGILKAIPKYFPEYEVPYPAENKIWSGLRPCSPDGMPYVGQHQKYKNLYFNTGHAMMGISLATGSGKLISELVTNKKLSMSTQDFSIHRFD